MSAPAAALRPRPPFAHLLKAWRGTRKLSQLDLSLSSHISQRHLSFLESGRARPSRDMVLQIADALEVPLRERNGLLTAAGFAPLYRQSALDDPAMASVRGALHLLLKHHEPNPAVVVDREWNMVLGNHALHCVFGLLGDLEELWRRVCGEGPRNVLKMTFHPDGLRPYLANWDEVAPVLLNRTRREAAAHGGDALLQLLDEVYRYPTVPQAWRAPDWESPPPPVVPLELVKGDLRLRLFSMISTFGTPQDVTTDELRVESFFPADAASAELLRRLGTTL